MNMSQYMRNPFQNIGNYQSGTGNLGGPYYGTDPVWQKWPDRADRLQRRSGRVSNRADWLYEHGFDTLGNVAAFRSGAMARRSDRINKRRQLFKDWIAGKKHPVKDTGDRIKDWVDDTRSKFYPGNIADKYKRHDPRVKWLDKAITHLNPAQYGQVIAGQLADWRENGPFGSRYAGHETKMLGNLESMVGRGYVNEALSDVLKFKRELAGQKSPLERAMERNYMTATTGGLTSPNSQFMEAQMRLADRIARRGDKRLAEEFGRQRGIGSGAYQRAMMDRVGELEDKAFAMGTELQKHQADQALKYLSESKAMENALLGHAVNLQSTIGGTRLGANKALITHLNNAAMRANEQADLALKQAKMELDAKFGQMDRLGNVIERDQNYDMAYKTMLANNFSTVLNSIMGALETGQGIAQNFMGFGKGRDTKGYLQMVSKFV